MQTKNIKYNPNRIPKIKHTPGGSTVVRETPTTQEVTIVKPGFSETFTLPKNLK